MSCLNASEMATEYHPSLMVKLQKKVMNYGKSILVRLQVMSMMVNFLIMKFAPAQPPNQYL